MHYSTTRSFYSKVIPNCIALTVLATAFLATTSLALAQSSMSQVVNLEPGWNIASTPKVLESHEFSTENTSENFDIYLLDPSEQSGWATMVDLGQTEFLTPETGTPGNQNNFGGPGSISPYNDEL